MLALSEILTRLKDTEQPNQLVEDLLHPDDNLRGLRSNNVSTVTTPDAGRPRNGSVRD
jgi:hypothetical protein